MKKIILSLLALTATLGVSADETTTTIEVIRIYSSERTGDAAAWPVAEYQNSTSSTGDKYRAELTGTDINIYRNNESDPLDTWTNTSSTKYRAELQRINVTTDGESDDNQYVNLGLTSGTLWAKTNVGGSVETDYGNYYAWGETTAWNNHTNAYPTISSLDWTFDESNMNSGYLSLMTEDDEHLKLKYSWANYKWGTGSQDCTGLLKYKSSSYSSLEPSDDAATVTRSKNWHTPSKSQCEELISGTVSYPITINGVAGYRFVKSGDASRYVFLPYAGALQQGQGAEPQGQGGFGSYWTNELSLDNLESAYEFDVDDYSGAYVYNDQYIVRCLGEAVRPVYSVPTLVTGVTVGQSSVTLDVAGKTTLTPTITPTDATYKYVSWSSSNTDVATVDAFGAVTGEGGGTAIITAKSVDGSNNSATCTVTVNYEALTSIKLMSNGVEITEATITPSTPLTLTAALTPSTASCKSITWTSSNEEAVKVSSSGEVTCVGTGDATITASVYDSKNTISAECTVHAWVPVTGIAVSDETGDAGYTAYMRATLTPSDPEPTYKTVTWSIDDSTGKVTIDENGTVDIDASATAGKYTVTATVPAEATGSTAMSATGTLTVVTPVSKVEFSPSTVTLAKGGTTTLTPVITPSGLENVTLTWSSSNTSVATVTQSGVVTASSTNTGMASIKVIAKSANSSRSQSGTCIIKVE